MADDEKLSIYAELHRRGQVPDEHKPIVEELVRRGVIGGVDRSFGGDEEMQKAYKIRKGGQDNFLRRVGDSMTFGALDEIGAGVNAALDTYVGPVIDQMRGKPADKRTFSENYDRNLKVDRALRDDARNELTGVPGVAADVVGGLMTKPGEAVAGVLAAARPAVEGWRQGLGRLATEYKTMAPQLAKTGAAWGGGNAFFGADGSPDPNASMADNALNRLSYVPAGALEGAAGALALGGALHGTLGARDIRRGQVADRQQRQQLNALEWNAEGMSAPGYLVAESPTARATAEGLSNTVVGRPIRNDAAARTAQLEERARGLLREHTEGMPSSDMGERLQGSLDRNLHGYSIPNREFPGMANAELERISGPVTQEGFRPPRSTIEPVKPRDVMDVTPEQFAAERLPGRVAPTEPQVGHTPWMNIPTRPDIAVRQMEHQLAVEQFNRKYNSGQHKNMRELPTEPPFMKEHAELSSIQAKIEDILRSAKQRAIDWHPSNAERVALPGWESKFPGLVPPNLRERLDRLRTIEREVKAKVGTQAEEYNALNRARMDIAAESDAYRNAEYSRMAREEHARVSAEANKDTLRRNAAAETEYRREQARLDAERETQSRQEAANRAYDQEVANSPNGFRLGRTRESYPTEATAGYERVAREMPAVNRNPLGAPNTINRTATESLINDFALDGFRAGRIQGYRHGEAFGMGGRVLHPEIMPYLRRQLGPEITKRLEMYAEARATPSGRNEKYPDGFPLDIKTLRDLRTAVRREAERRYTPQEPRTTDAAMLKRLEGALTEDMHSFLQDAGPQGVRASNMLKGVDAEYGTTLAEGLRRPLARIYGDQVAPIEAMNRLSRAAENGDLHTLRAFMRVMTEKDNPLQAATSIVAHMTEGAGNITSFLRGYRNLPVESRNVLFHGQEGAQLRQSFDRLETLMGQLEPFQRGIARGNGIDMSHLILGISSVAHFQTTLMLAGGANLTARFMSSPRYTNLLTRMPRAAGNWSAEGAAGFVARLAAIAQSDPDKQRGQEILNATKDMVLPSKAKAGQLSPADIAHGKSIAQKVLFAGKGARTADRKALAEAEGMDRQGASAADTNSKTGWFKGGDGLWRFEIDDSKAMVTKDGNDLISEAKKPGNKGLRLPLSQVFDHKALFDAYPALRNVPVDVFSEAANPYIKGVYGFMEPKSGRLVINADMMSKAPDAALMTILHEIGHRIQRDEKFAYGKSMSWSSDDYDRRPGEVESKDVEVRQRMNREQRRAVAPAITTRKDLDWGNSSMTEAARQ